MRRHLGEKAVELNRSVANPGWSRQWDRIRLAPPDGGVICGMPVLL